MTRTSVSLDDLFDEMQRGRIWECSLRDPDEKFQLDGLQVGENIYVDPRPAILETLLHELLHRSKPRLKERTVTTMARNLVISMDDATKVLWWKRYNRIKKKGRPVDI